MTSYTIRLPMAPNARTPKHKPLTHNTPNAETAKVLREADLGIGLEPTSLEKLRKEWDKACVK